MRIGFFFLPCKTLQWEVDSDCLFDWHPWMTGWIDGWMDRWMTRWMVSDTPYSKLLRSTPIIYRHEGFLELSLRSLFYQLLLVEQNCHSVLARLRLNHATLLQLPGVAVIFFSGLPSPMPLSHSSISVG